MHSGYGFQESYSMHQESSWESKNEYQSNGSSASSAMRVVPDLLCNIGSGHQKQHSNFEARQRQSSGRHAQNMQQNGRYGGGSSGSAYHHQHQNHHVSSGGKRLPSIGGGFKASSFSEAAMLNNSLGLGNTGFVYEEVHSSSTAPSRVRVQEVSYEHSSWGGDNGHNYCHDFGESGFRRGNGFQKFPWVSKGLWGGRHTC